MDDSPPDSRITEPVSRSDLKSIPTQFLRSLTSRVELMESILKKLQDDQVNAIGIFGMGAIGKTTVVKEIANKGARGMFDEIVIAEISEAPNVERIQYHITEQLGATLQERSPDERAIKLYNRLKEGKGDKNKRKILIILDNIWEKLDLSKVGIPTTDENTGVFCCKLLLTSRKKDVCEAMGVSATNIFEVHTLDENEARQLFRARVGEIINDGGFNEELEKVEKRLLKKCGGLPLTIVTLADVLKGKKLSIWEHFATELEKPTSSQGTISGVHQHTYSILETSYNLIESEEKKRFFLLACLFPLGSSIRVEDMMRYGIGLGLFQLVNNLIEALELANTWVDELKSSALLLQDDREGYVKIHDVVRASTISMTQKGVNMFMVDAFPQWLLDDTCQKYSAISLMSPADHSRVVGLNSRKLQILILDGTQPGNQFPDTFFGGMTNLKVLALKGMNFTMGLPNSTSELKKSLRALHLEDCDLGDIGVVIGELSNLLVLSLCESRINKAKFPAEAIRKLRNLRLLDLRGCKVRRKAIPAKVLSSLSQLEGLYAFDSIRKWAVNSMQDDSVEDEDPNDDDSAEDEDANDDDSVDNKDASIDELNNLNYLKVLEMQVSTLQQMPVDEEGDKFVRNLEQFFILISNMFVDKHPNASSFRGDMILDDMPECKRTLVIANLDVSSTVEKYSCVKVLLRKSDRLILLEVRGLDQLVNYHLENGSLEGVKELIIGFSDSNFVPTRIAFLNLEIFILFELPNLKNIDHLQATFSKLRCLAIDNLPEFEPYALPINALYPHLVDLHVTACPKLKFLFGKENEIENTNSATNNADITAGLYQFPSLKTLILHELDTLESMLGVPSLKCPSITTDNEENPQCLQDSQVLFNTELILPALETATLVSVIKIVTLWDFQRGDKYSTFHNLKELTIGGWEKLECLCSLSIAATFVQLKILRIINCLRIKVMIDDDKTNVKERPIAQAQPFLSIFPSLETLELFNCPKLHRFFSANLKDAIEFPSLQWLTISYCDQIHSFSSGICRVPKLRYITDDSWSLYSREYYGEDINIYLRVLYKNLNSDRLCSSDGSDDEVDDGEGFESEIEEVVS